MNTERLTKWLLPAGIIILLLAIGWAYLPDISFSKKENKGKSAYKPEKPKEKQKNKEGREVKEYILGATYTTYKNQPCLATLKSFEYEYRGSVRNDYGITYSDPITGNEIGRKGIVLPYSIEKHSFVNVPEYFVFFRDYRLSKPEALLMIHAGTGEYKIGASCLAAGSITHPEEVLIYAAGNTLSLIGDGKKYSLSPDSSRFVAESNSTAITMSHANNTKVVFEKDTDGLSKDKDGKFLWKERGWRGKETASRLTEVEYETVKSGFISMTNEVSEKIIVGKYLKYPYTLKDNNHSIYYVYEDNQKEKARIMLSLYSLPQNKIEWELWLLDIPEWQSYAGYKEPFNQYNYKEYYKTLHLIEFSNSVVLFTKNFWISATDKFTGKSLWSKDLHKTENIQ